MIRDRREGRTKVRHRPSAEKKPSEQLLHELGGDARREVAVVLQWVELHDVGTNHRQLEGLHEGEHLAHRQPARLAMGDAGREGGVERVDALTDEGTAHVIAVIGRWLRDARPPALP